MPSGKNSHLILLTLQFYLFMNKKNSKREKKNNISIETIPQKLVSARVVSGKIYLFKSCVYRNKE